MNIPSLERTWHIVSCQADAIGYSEGKWVEVFVTIVFAAAAWGIRELRAWWRYRRYD